MVNYHRSRQAGGYKERSVVLLKTLYAAIFDSLNCFPNIYLPPPFTNCLLIKELCMCVTVCDMCRKLKHNRVGNKGG